MERITVFVVVGVLVTGYQGMAVARPPYCDSDQLERVSRRQLDEQIRYQPRGKPQNRCEGLIGEEHARPPVSLVGLWKGCAENHLPVGELPANLSLAWSPPADPAFVRVKVSSLADHSPYLLDGRSDKGASRFEWPSGVLAKLGHTRAALAALAWLDVETTPAVYLPVSWEAVAPAPCTAEYQMLIRGLSGAQKVIVEISASSGAPSVRRDFSGDFRGPTGWVRVPSSDFSGPRSIYRVRLVFSDGGAPSNKDPRTSFSLLHVPVNSPPVRP